MLSGHEKGYNFMFGEVVASYWLIGKYFTKNAAIADINILSSRWMHFFGVMDRQ